MSEDEEVQEEDNDDICEKGQDKDINGDCVACAEKNTDGDCKECEEGDVRAVSGRCEDPCISFKEKVKKVLSSEGGFVNDPSDPGGATNKGVSWPVWTDNAKSVLGVEPTLDNLKSLSTDDANEIYKNLYWDKVHADDIEDGDLRFLLFDFYVNAGRNASKTLQRTVNELGGSLTIDGKIGSGTISAINSISDQVKLYNTYKENRQKYYDAIVEKSVDKYKTAHPNATEEDIKKNTFKRFENGWTNRVNEFKEKTTEDSKNVNCD